jgi:hypothetical protein
MMNDKNKKISIDRKALVRRHNPVLCGVNPESPLTVGNGEFAFTVDVTGLQSLYNEYQILPLCTMSQWGWHTELKDLSKPYTLDDVVMTRYTCNGRTTSYASERQPGNEAVYDWLRHNPHRLNLARVFFLWDGREIQSGELSEIHQELDLYSGVIYSNFKINGFPVCVKTVSAQSADIIGVAVEASSQCVERLSICIAFPYGSHNISASNWEEFTRHTTTFIDSNGQVLFKRELDRDKYQVALRGAVAFRRKGEHSYEFRSGQFVMAFSSGDSVSDWDFTQVISDSTDGWEKFWHGGGAVDFSCSTDSRAGELERRTILSQYLTAAQSAGSIPPQETGLSCNSWYGKFHLEMHILHAGWFPLWGHPQFLQRSIPWYRSIIGNARNNATRNGYTGARWPKMTGPEGIDSPSWIATLLIWQQPHLIYMLELIRNAIPKKEQSSFMKEHRDLIDETAQFMKSFLQFNKDSGRYDLAMPLIPAQEEHSPEATLNPTFELGYWRYGMELALSWAECPGKSQSSLRETIGKLAELPIYNGFYLAHQNCRDTFTAYNRDHPSMLYTYGFIPCELVDKQVMSNTVDRVLDCWERPGMWGWDFALMAMTLVRLGRSEAAIDVLLADSEKNCYTVSGNNIQRGRDDLPLYLPGNGSLLFALAMMLSGYGLNKGTIGFPRNGKWDGIKVEGISPLPY